MRAALARVLVAGTCLIAGAPAASADVVSPRSADAFRNSVGVATHVGYTDTAYANWPRLVARLDELGVRHLRDGAYGDPSPQAREYNRYIYEAIDLAAAHGMRFTFLMGGARSETGTLDQLVRVVAGRLRHATEALEAPNEFDKYVGGRNWAPKLAAYSRELRRRVDAEPSLRSLPVLAPSLANAGAERQLGDLRRWFDVGNVHPYTGGRSPEPGHLRTELADASLVSGSKRVWATETGFHNALHHRTDGQPPVAEQAGAVYLLRTFLEHFSSGIERTYAYELIDEKPDAHGTDPEQHFGLLRNDYSAKPAFTALKNLLTLVGRRNEQPQLRRLRLDVSSAGDDLRRLVLQKSDRTYLVALWRTTSVWDTDLRRPLYVRPRAVSVRIPGAARVELADPVASSSTRRLRLRDGRVRVGVAGRPLILRVTSRR
jgi:hypothetical protein